MKILSSIFLCFIFNTCAAGEVIMNKSYRDDVHSAQFFPVGNPLGYPLLALGSSEQLEINFDVFSEDFETLNYGVIHCSHDWKPSDLESGQYIRGFATNQISDIQYSFNTLTNYIHYRFNYPTDISQPTLS
ncbi:MAG: type IX secretion system plug protein domain-containing protein, partial [Flavobacteriales bacterium]